MVRQNNGTNKQDMTEILERVQALDLERITRMTERQQGWETARANAAEQEYRRYLALLLLYPDRQIAPPSKDADEIWHGHILDTLVYEKDCQKLFGTYLHHIPSYGTAEEKLVMASAREQTEALFERHFGQTTTESKNNKEVFWARMAAEQRKQTKAREEGCVPCFGRTAKEMEAARSSDGCVPCFGRREDHSKEPATVAVM